MKTWLRFGFSIAALWGLLGAGADPAARWFEQGRCSAFDRHVSQGPNARIDSEHLRLVLPKAATAPGYMFDPTHMIAAHVVDRGGAGSASIRFISSSPHLKTAPADLHAVQTTSGIKLGTSAATVVKTLGKPLILEGCGLQRYLYTVDKEVGGNMLAFTIAKGRVIEIDDTFGD